MKKVLGSVWLRMILCIGLYVAWFFLIRYLCSGALGSGMDNLNTTSVVILFAFSFAAALRVGGLSEAWAQRQAALWS